MNCNGNGLPQSMTSVIDLVVAVQAAQVARNVKKELRSWLRSQTFAHC